MTRRTRLLLAATAGASLLALAVASSHSAGVLPAGGAPLTTTSPLRAGPAPAVVTSPAASPSAPLAELGSRRTYEIDDTQTVTLSASTGDAEDGGAEPSGGEQTVLVTRIRASMAFTFVAADAGRLRFRGLLTAVNATANGEPYPDPATQRDLARPFFFETDKDGKVLSVAFDPATLGDARGVIKSLVAGSQVVVGASEGAWVTHEQDPTGEYEARYTQENGPLHLLKVRTRYLKIATESGLRDVADVGKVTLTDGAHIDLLEGGKLDKLTASARTDMQFGKGMPRVRSTFTLAVRLTGTDVDAAGLLAATDDWRREQKGDMASPPSQDDPKTREATRRAADLETLKAAKLGDLERDLAATPVASSRARSSQMARLQADFRLHPEDTQKVVRYVRTASVADGQAITGALGGAATPEALKALVDIAGGADTAMEVRVNAIAALAINPTPSAASVQGLKALTGDSEPDIRAASSLALGGAANTLRDADPAAYQDAVGALIAAFGNAQSADEKVLALRALGNSGDPRILALVEDAIKDPDTAVRVAAVTAVRRVPDAAADQVLMGVMQNDADATVRIQAIATAEGYRALAGYMGAFGAILQADPSALVRRAVVHALNVVRSTPAALALLAAAAHGDPSEDVRQLAKAVLDTPPNDAK